MILDRGEKNERKRILCFSLFTLYGFCFCLFKFLNVFLFLKKLVKTTFFFYFTLHLKMFPNNNNCRDPSFQDTWHASYSDTWHALSSGSPSSWSSYKTHMTRFSHPDYPKEDQTTLINTTSGRLYTIHPDDQHMSSRYNCLNHWLK